MVGKGLSKAPLHLRDRDLVAMTESNALALVAFPTPLGWMAMAGADRTLRALTLGHRTRAEAIQALTAHVSCSAKEAVWNKALIERLHAYARGSPEDFRDVAIDPGPLSEFHRRVVECCRGIRWGTTLSYGQLAQRAGFPRAARAVGRCMAANRIPLVVPCHRVVGADGALRGFSAAGGTALKRRLLELETAPVSPQG